VAISNAGPSDGRFLEDKTFIEWRDVISQSIEQFSTVMDLSTTTDITGDDKRAYDAPYPSMEYTAGPRQLPAAIPFAASLPEAQRNAKALELWSQSDLPLLTIFSDPADGIERVPTPAPAGQERFTVVQRSLINTAKGAKDQPHANIDPAVAGHFVSENAPDQLNKILLVFAATTAK
jgi:haloalkane dehalogenase